MNKDEMIAKTVEMIESQSGFAYNKQIVIDTINAGTIPDGTVLYDDGENKLVIEGNDLINYLNGSKVKATAMVGEAFDNVLMMYASNQSRLNTKIG
jgi:hypothetical protein